MFLYVAVLSAVDPTLELLRPVSDFLQNFRRYRAGAFNNGDVYFCCLMVLW